MQLLLIQTQVMKVDMESALLQMDQIMRANRLNFSLMAGMPALLAGFMSTSLGSTSLGEYF
jgi:nuclear-control-of-ATPase protein 2